MVCSSGQYRYISVQSVQTQRLFRTIENGCTSRRDRRKFGSFRKMATAHHANCILVQNSNFMVHGGGDIHCASSQSGRLLV